MQPQRPPAGQLGCHHGRSNRAHCVLRSLSKYYCSNPSESDAIEAGCDDYDIKPIEFDRLIDKIERLLGLAKIQVR
jgi:DNA-binding response OmpR family regulator